MEKAFGNIVLLVLIALPFLFMLLAKARNKNKSAVDHEHGSTANSHTPAAHAHGGGHGHDDHHGHHGPGPLSTGLAILVIMAMIGGAIYFFWYKPVSQARPMTRDAWHMPRGPLMARTKDDTSPLTYTCKGKGAVTATIAPGEDIFVWLNNQTTMKILPEDRNLVISAAGNASLSTSNGGTLAVSTHLFRMRNTRAPGSEPIYMSCCYQSADSSGSCMQ